MRIHAFLAYGLAASFLSPSLFAQYLRIRELDSNDLVDYENPLRIRGGVAVGQASTSSARVPVLWDSSGTRLLPLLPGTETGAARDLSESGEVVGDCFDLDAEVGYATLWRGGNAIDLNSLVTGGDPLQLLSAASIDRHGRIIGQGISSAGFVRAFLFSGGIVTDLGALPNNPSASSSAAMNDRGAMVGASLAGNYFTHAVLWEGGALVDLHDPSQIPGNLSLAMDVDRQGRICGYADFLDSRGRTRSSATLWDHGTITDLRPSDHFSSIASGMNDFGSAVGNGVEKNEYYPRAYLFTQEGAIRLNDLIDPESEWELHYATDIDNEGRIVGWGFHDYARAAFMIAPLGSGRFASYGTACPGTGGVEPTLVGTGFPSPDHDFALVARDGVPGAPGFLFVGSDRQKLSVKPGCDLQVLPLVASPRVILLDGFGEAWLPANLPGSLGTFDLTTQVFLLDAGAAYGIAATRPLAIHFE